MSIKSLLSKLLDSFLANKKSDVSHYAMPSAPRVNLSLAIEERYIVPYDGIICIVRTQAAAGDRLNISINEIVRIETSTSVSNRRLALQTLVSKGDTLHYFCSTGAASSIMMFKSNGSV